MRYAVKKYTQTTVPERLLESHGVTTGNSVRPVRAQERQAKPSAVNATALAGIACVADATKEGKREIHVRNYGRGWQKSATRTL